MEETSKKDWLKRLQNESWEPEILISGIVIYGLFKIFPYVNEFHIWLENYGSAFFGKGTADNTVIALIQISISWLLIGFITHLFLRSFWVAYIGLSYVYDDRINYQKLKYHKVYLRNLQNNNRITPNIEKLEKVCSSLFAVSILFFMNVLGLILITCVIGILIYFYSEFLPLTTRFDYYVDNFFIIIFFICSIDYLTSGLLKRIPFVNRIFYPLYKVINFILLAPLYRKIYYTFITNHKKWKVFLVLSLFIIISIFSLFLIRNGVGNSIALAPSAFTENVMSPSHYLDEAEGNFSKQIWISSQKIEEEILEVFVVHTPAFEDIHIKPLCDYSDKVKKEDVNISELKLECLNQFYSLTLNDKTVKENFFYTKSYKTKQDGLKYFIPIDSLIRGRHTLKLYYNFYNKEKDTTYKRIQAKTDFYKATPKVKT